MEQTMFSSLAWSVKKKTTHRQAFMAEMESMIAWERFIRMVEPIYPDTGAGPQPHPLERMLRIHFMQIWFNLSDSQAEDCLYDIESMRRFAGIDLESDAIPDEATILCFRHLLQEHHLSEQIFAEVRSILEQRTALGDQAHSSQEHRVVALERIIRTRINGLIIRRATPKDASTIRQFLVELATYHECLGDATITEDVIG